MSYAAEVARSVPSTSSAAEQVQARLLREAGSARRFARARSLSASVVSLARRAIRNRHPGWSENDVLLEFVRTHYGEELAAKVRRRLQRSGR